MDVGGGSVELVRFRDRRLERAWSMQLGSLRMSDRFLESDPPAATELQGAPAGSSPRRSRTPGSRELGPREDLVGIGGTVRNLAKVDLKRADYPLPLLHGYFLKERRLDALIDETGRALDEAARADARAEPGPRRHDRGRRARGRRRDAARRRRQARRVEPGPARGTRARDRGRAGDPVARLGPHDLRRRRSRPGSPRGTRRSRTAAPRSPPAARGARPRTRPRRSREMLGHAATLLDVGRAIDYYDRFEHAAMIVTAADLGGVHARGPRGAHGDPATGRRRHAPRARTAHDRSRRPRGRAEGGRPRSRSPTS